MTPYHVKNLLDETTRKLAQEAIPCQTEESKTTSGGYFARYLFAIHSQAIGIEFNISLRERVKGKPILVTTPFIPHYQCLSLPIEKLVREKIEALLRRKKPRDFFDLYFLLRERRGINEIIRVKERLIAEVKKCDASIMRKELKLFLPLSHQGLLKSFPKILASELNRC